MNVPYRNTEGLTQEFRAEATALGCVQVPLEIFEKVLTAQCVAEGNTSNHAGHLDVLCVLEDYNHAYVKNGCYFLAQSYLVHYGFTS